MDNSTNTSDSLKKMTDGYDLPVYGLATGTFYYLHVSALFCILCSFICVLIAIIMSFRQKDYKNFFSRTKSERFIVYLAICDGGFNVFHSMDHMQYVITKDHVKPIELCEFYGFILAEFVASQVLMVNIVALNAFMLMVFKKNLNFGKHDWRLLVYTFGLPFVGATAVAVTGQLGPNGSSCFFDGVKADVANIAFTTIPLLLVLIVNIIMYGITWYRILVETNSLRFQIRNASSKSKRAAKNMSLFVVAFFIQWGPLALFGIWYLIGDERPLVLFHIVTVFSNIGGCLNLCVYILIRRARNQNRKNVNGETQIDSNEMKGVCSENSKQTIFTTS